MPSDARIEAALRVLSRPTEAFRSAAATTAEEIRSYLATHSACNGKEADGLASELGPFGASRIDVPRLSSLFADHSPIEPLALKTLEQALETLSQVGSRKGDVFRVEVAPGGDLRDTVAEALAGIGRAFGAARAVDLLMRNRGRPPTDPRVLGPLPFREWTKAQRSLAPPLLIHLDGSDLHAGALAEFLDGTLKLVLVVRGESPPAPLVRLITPQTFVLQTIDDAGLDRMIEWKGPGVAAILPENAARFVHDPSGGPNLWDRLTVSHVPQEEPRKPLRGMSAEQQAEELHQLRALANRPAEQRPAALEQPSTAAPPAATDTAADQVERLAAWLISQAGMDK